MRCRLLCLPALSEFTDELGPSLCSRCLPSTNRFKPKFCEPIQLSQSEERRELQKEHLVLHNARRRFQPFACSHPFQGSLFSPLLSSLLLSSPLFSTQRLCCNCLPRTLISRQRHVYPHPYKKGTARPRSAPKEGV